MIIPGIAPMGAAYLAINCAGVAVSKITTSQGLGAGDVFAVWGSLGSSNGGAPNDFPLGTMNGNGIAPALALAWTRLLFKRTSGTGTGSLYVQGPTWARSAPTGNALPTLPTIPAAWSAPLSFAANGPAYVLSLDDGATAADSYQVWGTNDATARTPASAAGATLLGQLRGGGVAPPVLVVGYELVIVRCISHGAAAELIGVETLNDGFTSLATAPGPPAGAWSIGGNTTPAGVQGLGTLEPGAALEVYVAGVGNVVLQSDGSRVTVAAPAGLLSLQSLDGEARLTAGDSPLPSPVAGRVLLHAQTNMAISAAETTEIGAGQAINLGALATALGSRGNLPGQQQPLLFNAPGDATHVGFAAPDTVAASVVWKLPAADGTPGEVLSTDGAGNLTWVTPPRPPA